MIFRRKSLQKSGGTIAAIVFLLLGYVTLRVTTNAGSVMAQAQENVAETTGNTTDKAVENAQLDDEELDAMLQAFQRREARIAEQEEQILRRMKALEVADIEISKRLEELTQAEDSLRATIAMVSTAAEDDLARLTAVYENMKPKDAAALFQEMAPEFAAGFLGRMRPDAAAAVMAGLTPDAAYSVSAILAGRNANAPTE